MGAGDETRSDDPVEAGALEDEPAAASERPPASDDPVEAGALEDEPEGA